jgi:hypothetical protein
MFGLFNFKIKKMANFTTEDLAFTGYSQTVDEINNTNQIEIYDAIYVDKSEECEVVHFCNQFLEKYKVPQTKASFQRVESFLQHSILEHQIYREELLDWIASNWIKL